jgi:hypothetical protein
VGGKVLSRTQQIIDVLEHQGCYELNFGTHEIGFEFENNPPHHYDVFLDEPLRFFFERALLLKLVCEIKPFSG